VSNRPDVSELVSAIYDAALDPACWPLFLDRLAGALDAPAAGLHLQSTGAEQSGQILAATGIDPALQREYDEYYASVNIWTIRGRDQLREGAVLTGQMICPDGEVEHSEYYNDYLRRLGYFHAIAAIPVANADTHLFVTGLRPRGQGGFCGQSQRLLHVLTPHLQRAVSIHRRLSAAEVERAAMADVVERSGRGVAFLDRRGRPVFVNTALDTILKARDGLVLTKDGLSATAHESSRALHALIANAEQGGSGGTLAVPRPSGAPPYSVLVSLVPKHAPILARTEAAVLVVVSDPASPVHVDVELLRTAYGLTTAEARIASRLANGADIDAVARHLRITVSTARTHLKRILHKTGARRQSELVRLVLLTR
jgi:DNA-binding CsgD family transcriptional regulator